MAGIKIEVDSRTAESALKRLEKDFKDVGLSAEKAEKEAKKLETKLKKKLGADQSTKAMNSLQKSLGLTDREMKNMNRRLGTSKVNLSKFKSNIADTTKNITKMGTALGGLALVGVGAGVVKLGAEFEKTMDIVQGVSGAVGQSLDDLTNIAKEMGETTEFSATQAAEGLRFLTMAGFNAEQSISALPGVLDLATAGNLDLGQAADIASNALTAMGLDVSELSRVNDTFVATISNSNTNIEQMAESFKYAAPSANAFGYSIEELNSLIGTLGSAGIQGCYDEKTEVLTKNGFKFWKDVNEDDEFLTLNPKTKEIEYQKATKHFKYEVDEKLFHIKNRHIDLKVTKNHNMFVQLGRNKNNDFQLIQAKDIEGKEIRFTKTGLWKGKEKKSHTISAIEQNTGNSFKHINSLQVPMNAWLEFVGMWITDGSADHNKGNYRIRITQIKEHTKPQIRKILNQLPWNFNENKSGFVIHNQQLYYELINTFGRLKKDRIIPEYIKELSSELLEKFYNGYNIGDGDCNGALYTSYKQLLDGMSEIILKIGWGVKSSVVTNKDDISIIKGREVTATKTGWKINVNKKQLNPSYIPSDVKRRPSKNVFQRWEHYKGFVYCAEVPNHVLFVRRNGKTVFCGNSMAGTQLAFAFKNVNKVFKEIGEDGTGKNLYDAIKAIEQANWDAIKVGEIFGERGGRAVNSLLQDYKKAKRDGVEPLYEKLLDLNNNAVGATQRLAQIMRDNLIGDLKTLESTLSGVGLDVFSDQQETLRDIIKDTTEYIRENREEIIEFGSGLGEAFTDLVKFGGSLVGILDNTLTGWNALPEIVQKIGIVGALVGGVEAKVAMGILVTAAGLIEESFKMAEIIDENESIYSRNKVTQLQRENSFIKLQMALNKQYIKEKQEAIKKQGDITGGVEKQIKRLKDKGKVLRAQWIAKEAEIKKEAILESKGKKHFEDIQNARTAEAKKSQEDITKITEDESLKRIYLTEEEFDAYYSNFDTMENESYNLTSSMTDAYMQMYGSIDEFSQESYDLQIQNLEDQEKVFAETTGEYVLAHKWYLSEVKKVDDERSKHFADAMEADRIESGTFFDGMIAGLEEIDKETKTVFKQGQSHVKGFVGDVEDAFSSAVEGGLYSFLEGDVDALGLWRTFWDDVTVSVLSSVAEMIAAWAVMEATSGILRLVTGGEVKLHEGTLGADEGLAILQGGEMVIPKNIATDLLTGDYASFNDWLNNKAANPTIVDTAAGNDIAQFDPLSIDTNFSNDRLNSMLSDAVSNTTTQQNYNGMGGLVGNAGQAQQLTQTQQDYLSAMVTGMGQGYQTRFAQAVTNAIGYSQLGVRVEPHDFLDLVTGLDFHSYAIKAGLQNVYSEFLDKEVGLTGEWANAGEFIGSGMLGFLTGGNPIAMAAGQLIGGYSLELLGDGLNMRSGEELKDDLEDKFSRLEAAEVYSALTTGSLKDVKERFGPIGDLAYSTQHIRDNWSSIAVGLGLTTVSPEIEEAVRHLNDTYGLDLTGSPIQNTTNDLFSAPEWDNYEDAVDALESFYSDTTSGGSDGYSGDTTDYGSGSDFGGGKDYGGGSSDFGGGKGYGSNDPSSPDPSGGYGSSSGGGGGGSGGTSGGGGGSGGTSGGGSGGDRGGGGEGKSDSSGHSAGSYHKGGILGLRNDEGWFTGKKGEGVVNPDGMELLEKINSGNINGFNNEEKTIHVHVYLNGDEITSNIVEKLTYDTDLIEGVRRAI